MGELNVGDKAPDFRLGTNEGDASLSGFAGRPLVLYFYPKDDTSGCTKQAIAFTERKADFDRLGATILGVSRDSLESHRKFQDKYSIAFPLGADPEGEVCERYGVWVEKSMYGRKYMGIERSTFLIDKEGVVRRIWRKVKVPGHADEVLSAVKGL